MVAASWVIGIMPKDLPGFYFDVERNRYFPKSFRSGRSGPGRQEIKNLEQEKALKNKVECEPSSNVDTGVLQLLHQREVGRSPVPGSCKSTTAFKRQYLEIQTSQPRVWSYRGFPGSADGAVEQFHANFQTHEGFKEANVLACGGSNISFGICEILQSNDAKVKDHAYYPRPLFPSDGSNIGTERPPHLSPPQSLPISSSKLTAIKRLGTGQDAHDGSVILTTLGSAGEGGALYLLKQGQYEDECWENGQPLPFNIQRSVFTDCSVWTTACSGSAKATLGTSRGAALVNLDRSSLEWLFHSKSDVLSQQCDSTGNIVLSGFRNGSISTVDTRVPLPRPRRLPARQNSQELSLSAWRQQRVSIHGHIKKSSSSKFRHGVAGKYSRTQADDRTYSHAKSMQMGSAICSMVLLHSDETYLLASSMNGNIQLWDRRLVEKGPVLSYEGNCNSHSMLQLGIDPSETLFASGGEDCSIRIWSLRSGKLLQTISHLPSPAYRVCSPIELGRSTTYGWSSTFKDNVYEQEHAWGMWIGSFSELLYVHSGATHAF